MRDFYTVGEAAKHMGVSDKTLRKWDDDGTFPASHKVGQHRRYSKQQIEAFLNKKLGNPNLDPVIDISKKELIDRLEKAGTKNTLDFNEAFGDTIKEKYDSLYRILNKISAAIFRDTEYSGPNLLIASPETAVLFETCTLGFSPHYENSVTNGKRPTMFSGTLNNRWLLYRTIFLPPNKIYLTYREDQKVFDDSKFSAEITLVNWDFF